MARSSVDIANISKATPPRVAFNAIKNAILGPTYELTIVIAGPQKMRELNRHYRNISKPTDILSFPLSDNEGEIYICPSETRRQARVFGRTYENFFAYLFIHGCVHLKGYDHGGTMESVESKFRTQFRV